MDVSNGINFDFNGLQHIQSPSSAHNAMSIFFSSLDGRRQAAFDVAGGAKASCIPGNGDKPCSPGGLIQKNIDGHAARSLVQAIIIGPKLLATVMYGGCKM